MRICRLSRIVLAAVAALTVSAASAHALTYTVNSALDDVGPVSGNGRCQTAAGNGVCTLRQVFAELQALANAGTLPSVTVWLDIPGGTLTLTNGAPRLQLTYSGSQPAGEVVIAGMGMDATIISASDTDGPRFSGVPARLMAMTIRHARTAIEGTDVSLDHVRLADSFIGYLGGSTTRTVTISGGEFVGNVVAGASIAGTAPLQPVRFVNTFFVGNLAWDGGGLSVGAFGRVELLNATFTGNHARDTGGAVLVSPGATLHATNTTISGNSAGGAGGGIYNNGGTVVLAHSTIANNDADSGRTGAGSGGGLAVSGPSDTTSLRLSNSIVAGNRATTFNGTEWVRTPGDCSGSLTTSGTNLFSVVDCTIAGTAPVVGVAGLGSLQDNGGPVHTHDLAAGSPAIDGGGVAPCQDAAGAPLTRDQRGLPRLVGAACDLGAVESGAIAPWPTLSRDLNGDERADFIWRHPASGRSAVWFMNGTTVDSAAFLAPLGDLRWDVIANGDFDGDGRSDLLWQRETGELAMWFMHGSTIRAGQYLPSLEERAWRVAGVGDFDGDARADILWQRDGGRAMLWLVDGSGLKERSKFPELGAGWEILGAADANGDRRTDILWRHAPSALNAIWVMNGARIVAGNWLPAMLDPGWTFAGFTDWNNDERADVLWRTTSPIQGRQWVGVWHLVDGEFAQSIVLTAFEAGWQFVKTIPNYSTGADLLWRQSSTGQLGFWNLRSGTPTIQFVPRIAEPGWELR